MIELLFRLLNLVKLKEFPSLADEQLNHLRAIHLDDEFHDNKKYLLIVECLLVLPSSIPNEQHDVDLSFVQFGRSDT